MRQSVIYNFIEIPPPRSLVVTQADTSSITLAWSSSRDARHSCRYVICCEDQTTTVEDTTCTLHGSYKPGGSYLIKVNIVV